MPLGIDDTWVDGFESYVLVGADDATTPAARFGRVVAWWPRDLSAASEEPMHNYPRFGDGYEAVRKRISVFAMKERGLPCVCVQSGRSNSAPWTRDEDYHPPMYRDALAAMRQESVSGPELYETPVRIAARLSRELSTVAAALWGSDEEPGLEGLCMFESGVQQWAASTYSVEELSRAFDAYTSGSDPELEWREDPEGYFLVRPDGKEEFVEGSLPGWADAQLRAAGLGIDLSLSPHNMHPHDFVGPWLEGIEQFVVAVDSEGR